RQVAGHAGGVRPRRQAQGLIRRDNEESLQRHSLVMKRQRYLHGSYRTRNCQTQNQTTFMYNSFQSSLKHFSIGIHTALLASSAAALLHPALSPGAECVYPPPGLVSWWSGDGNAKDIFGGNPGELSTNRATFIPGVVG